MKQSYTRRDLAKVALATSTLAPLISAETNMPKPELDPVHWTLESYKSAPLKLTFQANNKTQAERWQHEWRAKLTELLGGFPHERVGLRPQSIETRDYPHYQREKFLFTSRPGVAVSGYLLMPKNVRTPVAAVICVPGHGRGVDDIVGIDEHGADRTTKAGYQHDFAIQVVEHGMAAVAIEPMAFGCRRDAANIQKGPGQSACQPAAGAALLFGQTMIGWRVWDVMRTIDWIEQRKELDSKRVGCVGISGGGTCTQFSAALDTRIKAAFVSGYLNTFRDSIMSISHCIDNYVPGILNWGENYDVAGLIAPRFFFSEGGDRDPIFPVAATRFSFGKVQKVYQAFGVPERAGQEIFAGEHSFHGEKGLPFLKQALNGNVRA
jgi:dienelactone hydrolase